MSDMTLREIAKLAKARLKNGNYNRNQNKQFTDLKGSYQIIDLQKVIEIVESDEIIENPIHRLIDKKHYEALSDTAKQRYILEVARSYIKLKQMYLNYKKINKVG